MSTDIHLNQAHVEEVSRQPQNLDDFYEYYNPELESPPQRQQRIPTPASQKPPSSLESASVRSLRRTPRLEEQRRPRLRSPPAEPNLPAPPQPRLPSIHQQPPAKQQSIAFGGSGSTTPQSFRNLVELDTYWPQRSIHISRKTHEAILFALEAIRAGKGVNARLLTADSSEEEARMSDLVGGGTPSGARTQNGSSSRTAPGAAANTPGQPRFRTPTVVMAERRAREARRAEQEAAQRRQEENSKIQQTEGVVGVGDRQRGNRASVTDPQPTAAVAGQSSRRRTEPVPTTNGVPPRAGPTTINQGQPRPVSSQQQSEPSYSGQVHKNRSEALEKLSMPAVAGARPPQPQNTNLPQPTPPAQPSTRTQFPHAFERWETLSSHWEGLTSYWIRRLQSNTDELESKPIDQQMARQITDLSAAGANLFHAVVELQRLRASSERKFQRWFFETRNEQEQSQEQIAELERQLRHERDSGNQSTASFEAIKAEKSKAEELVREMRRELQISKEEARRAWEELGRREQEDRDHTIALRSGEPAVIGGVQVVPMAGPGLASRQATSASRPQTRGGPIAGGPGPSSMSGQHPAEPFSRSQTTLESPDQEQAQFNYQPGGTSPTETDPFTETARANESPQLLRHEPDTQFYGQTTRSQPTSSAAAMAAARTGALSSNSGSGNIGHFYQQPGTSTTVYQPISATAPLIPPPNIPIAGTERSDSRSYIPSVSGNGSEEEFHINPDGSYTRDVHGRRIPYNQPISGPGEASDEDEEDYSADVERERLYAQQYSQRQQPSSYQTSSRTTTTIGGNTPSIQQPTTSSRTTYASPQPVLLSSQAHVSPESQHSYSSTISGSSPQRHHEPADYEGSGYGSSASHQQQSAVQSSTTPEWSAITTRHTHPTRLSDIVEEHSVRTSPSRMSYASGGGDQNATGIVGGYSARQQ